MNLYGFYIIVDRLDSLLYDYIEETNMDGRILKGQETKVKIMFATLEYIAEFGLKNLSASKVAKLAGVSKSNVFHHFESIEKLPVEAMKLLICDVISINKMKNCNSFKELLEEIGHSMFDLDEQHTKLYRAFFVLYNESFHDVRYAEVIHDIKFEFASILKEIIISLEGDNFEDLEDYCHLIAIVADGFGCHYLTDLNSEYYTRVWALQVEMLLMKLETLRKK